MNKGFVQQVDTPQHLYDMPCNKFVAGFIGSPQMNFINAKISKEGSKYFFSFADYKIELPESKSAGGKLDAYVGKEVTVGIRPEHIHDDPEFVAKAQAGVVEAKVEVTELMGAEIYLYLSIGNSDFTARVAPTSTAKPGDTVKVAFDVSRVHLFDNETEQVITN